MTFRYHILNSIVCIVQCTSYITYCDATAYTNGEWETQNDERFRVEGKMEPACHSRNINYLFIIIELNDFSVDLPNSIKK